MKMSFQRHGRQFFFFTFCVEGRWPVLATICKGGGPSPRAPATVVQEGCASPSLAGGSAPSALPGSSGGSAPSALPGGSGGNAPRPLSPSARPIHGGGNAEAHTELLPAGEPLIPLLKSLHVRNPALTASDRVVMPDHIHFILIVDFDKDPGFQPLAFAHRFMQDSERQAGTTGLWEPGFWLMLSFSSRQLSAIRHYIRHNPVRALWKAEHTDRFRRYVGIRHSILDPALRWSASGDLTLLGSPFLFPVRLTRRRSPEAQEDAISEAVERARNGMIPVCGFISPAERVLQQRLRVEPRVRWIKMVPHGLPARYDPSVDDSRAFAEGRMLVLSSFAPDVPASPISRANCELMNARILRLCGPAAEAINTSTMPSGGSGAEPPSFVKSSTP